MTFNVNKKKIAMNTLALYARQAVTMFISFFSVRITLEQLGVEDYGLNNLLSSIVSLFSFINASMGTAVQRYYSIEIGRGNEERLGKVFGVGLYLHSIVALITFALAEIFTFIFLEKMNIPQERMLAAHVVFQISIVSLCLGILNVPYAALLRSREMFSYTAIVEIIQALFRLGVLYLLVHITYDKLVSLAALNFCISLAGIFAYTVMARRFAEARNWFCRDNDLIKGMLSFISMLIVTVLAQLFNVQGVAMLMNLFFGLKINAAYAIATQVNNAVMTFVSNFKSSMVPQMVAAYGAGDLNSMHMLIDVGTKITFVMMLMITAPVIFESEWILTIWLGTPPEYAARFVSLVLININISSFTYFLYQGVHATGKIAKQQTLMSFSYIFGVVSIWVCFEIGKDFYYAMYAGVVISALQCLINIIFAHLKFSYNVIKFIRGVLLPALAVASLIAVSFVLVHKLIGAGLFRFAVSCALDCICVPAFGYFLLFSKKERCQVFTYVRKILKKRCF